MIIDVLRLEEGVSSDFREELDAKQIDVEYVDLHYQVPIQVKGTAEKILNTLTFRGDIESKVERICARCLKAVEEIVEDKLNLSYDVKGVERVDLTEDIRDVLLLSHSERFLCDANCKGLCPQCGINLNEKKCQCVKNNPNTNAFSNLKDYYKNKKQ